MNAKRMPSMPFVPRPTVAVATRFTNRLGAVLVASALVGATAVHADWLVLRSGDAVETRGTWKVEGPKVVFTSTRGVLSSVRATEVDVDASRTLTTRKQEEATKGVATPVPTPKRTPVLVLTDKDFAKEPTPDGAAAGEASAEGAVEGEAPAGESDAPPAEGAAGEGEDSGAVEGRGTPAGGAQSSAASPGAAQQTATAKGAGGAAVAPSAAAAGSATATGSATASSSATARASAPQRAAAPSRGVAVPKQAVVVVPSADSLETRVARQMPGPPALRVASWSARPTGDDQLSIFGEVVNGGSRVTAAINVAVTLIDSEGKRLGSTEALVSSTALMPNAQADFEARFPSDTNFNEVQFTLKTVELELGQPVDGEELDEPVGDEPHATAKTSAKPRS